MPKTVIFDLGGVLVNLDWGSVCDPLARLSELSDDAVRMEVQNGPIVELSMLGHLDPPEFHAALCAKLNINIAFEEFIDIWNGLLSANDEMTPLVEELGLSHPLVLASNTDAIHFMYSRQNFGVLGNFGQFFLSYEMGLLKPDPDYFRHVLDRLKIDAGECLFIDDRSENVLSAQQSGMKALVFESVDKLKSDLKRAL